MNRRQAERYTRRLALAHYENFIVGGVLTPRSIRQDFYNVYAYCRVADDLADEISDDVESLARLDQWSQWLVECYDGGSPQHPVFIALAATIRRFKIPAEPFLQLLDAFRQDQRVKRYAHFEDVVAYCQRSANPVGHLVLYLGECYTTDRALLADHICTGLQLANFCQDIRRDAQMGRVYIPTEELRHCGVDPASLESDTPPPGAQSMLEAQVQRAEEYFQHGSPLMATVPGWLRRNVSLFIGGGRAILEEIRRSDYDVWTARPRVGTLTRARLIWRAFRE